MIVYLQKIENINREKLDFCENQMLKFALKNAFNRPIDNLFVEKSQNGKPRFVKSNEDVFFSISHTVNLLAIAFSKQDVGFDLQIEKSISKSCYRFFGMEEDENLFFQKFVKAEATAKLKDKSLMCFCERKGNEGINDNYQSVKTSEGTMLVDDKKYFWCASTFSSEEVNFVWVKEI